MKTRPTLEIVAGPNGVGKSTLANVLFNSPQSYRFINADIIARGLNLSNESGGDIEAGRVMLESIRHALEGGQSFGFETTLSAKTWTRYILKAKELDYTTHLLYITVSDVSICLLRIKERVSRGGHNIPEETVRRRFFRSRSLFYHYYRSLCDDWFVFENSGEAAQLIAKKEEGGTIRIIDELLFERLFADVQ